MKTKQPKSKIQAILFERKLKIVDLFNIIKSQNDRPVAKYMISQIVNGQRTNYEIITLNKVCRALGVSPNDIIEDNPSKYKSKGIKFNTKSTKPVNPSKHVVIGDEELAALDSHDNSVAIGDEEFENLLIDESARTKNEEEPMAEHDGMRYNPENPEKDLEEERVIVEKIYNNSWARHSSNNESEGYTENEVEIKESEEDFGF